jgi:hypothetical protein
MRLAIAISPSRDRSSTEPISRRYMRIGSSVRPVGSAGSDRLLRGRLRDGFFVTLHHLEPTRFGEWAIRRAYGTIADLLHELDDDIVIVTELQASATKVLDLRDEILPTCTGSVDVSISAATVEDLAARTASYGRPRRDGKSYRKGESAERP